MKSTSVRGTPMRSIKAGNTEGMRAGKPAGYDGTVNKQFEGDQKGNRQEGISTGTPYQSQDGNGAESKRVRSHGLYGDVVSGGENMSDPSSNGNGVLFDGVDRASGNKATARPAMDSPVHGHAPVFDAHNVHTENVAHLGKGVHPAIATEGIADIPGGVLSRGMIGTSTPKGGEEELLEDDVLRNLGAGGAVG